LSINRLGKKNYYTRRIIILLSTLIMALMNFVSHHIDFSVLINYNDLLVVYNLHKINYHGRQNDIIGYEEKIIVYDIVFCFLKYIALFS